MRKVRWIPLTLLALLVTATVALAGGLKFKAHLNGSQEVPVRDVNGQGQALFHLSDDGTELHYKLIAANIENVFMAHIHLGPPGVNGPIVVWLYPAEPLPSPITTPPPSFIDGRQDGVLAEGVITAEDVIDTTPNDGIPFTLEDLLAAMTAGNTYVNIHTNDFVAPPNTGPGDFPGGEIRGDLHQH